MNKKDEDALIDLISEHPILTILTFPIWLPIALIVWITKKCSKKRKSTPTADKINLSHIQDPIGKGFRYEKYVAEHLRQCGYKEVSVTQRSSDFGADIIAYEGMGAKICIQCKYYKGSVGVSAIQEVNTAKAYYDADVAAIFTNSTYTRQAQELAAKCKVKLFRLDMETKTTSPPGLQSKEKDNLDWIDQIEDYHAFMDD